MEKGVVNMNKRSCTCNSWGLTGIPYGHVSYVSVIVQTLFLGHTLVL